MNSILRYPLERRLELAKSYSYLSAFAFTCPYCRDINIVKHMFTNCDEPNTKLYDYECKSCNKVVELYVPEDGLHSLDPKYFAETKKKIDVDKE